jgi:hypothetical protein
MAGCEVRVEGGLQVSDYISALRKVYVEIEVTRYRQLLER